MRRFVLVVVLAASACGAQDRGAVPPLDVGVSNVAVMKARRAQDDYVVVLETLTRLADVERPDRVLRRFRAAGGAALDYAAPAGATIADFAAHPEGEVTVLLVNDAGYALERWLPDGARGGAVEVAGVVPTRWSRDAGRVAAAGDDDVLAVRADDNSVRGLRYTPDGAGYRMVWDVVIEPANDLLAGGLTSGSYDTFGQMREPFRAYVDVGADAAVWVGVAVDPASGLLDAHNAAFGDDLGFVAGPQPSSDLLVTRLDSAGRRLFSRVVGTPWRDQVYGMRAVGPGLLVVGRSSTRPGVAGGWDGLVIRVAEDGTAAARTVDVNAGDILFDADLLSDGRTVAVGGTGYIDNPTGASVSEACSLLAVVLTDAAQTSLALPSLPRHDHLRTLVVDGTTAWVAGMSNGPGTHSGDSDPSAIRADPFVATLAVP